MIDLKDQLCLSFSNHYREPQPNEVLVVPTEAVPQDQLLNHRMIAKFGISIVSNIQTRCNQYDVVEAKYLQDQYVRLFNLEVNQQKISQKHNHIYILTNPQLPSGLPQKLTLQDFCERTFKEIPVPDSPDRTLVVRDLVCYHCQHTYKFNKIHRSLAVHRRSLTLPMLVDDQHTGMTTPNHTGVYLHRHQLDQPNSKYSVIWSFEKENETLELPVYMSGEKEFTLRAINIFVNFGGISIGGHMLVSNDNLTVQTARLNLPLKKGNKQDRTSST